MKKMLFLAVLLPILASCSKNEPSYHFGRIDTVRRVCVGDTTIIYEFYNKEGELVITYE